MWVCEIQSDKRQCPLAWGKAFMSSQGRYLPAALSNEGLFDFFFKIPHLGYRKNKKHNVSLKHQRNKRTLKHQTFHVEHKTQNMKKETKYGIRIEYGIQIETVQGRVTLATDTTYNFDKDRNETKYYIGVLSEINPRKGNRCFERIKITKKEYEKLLRASNYENQE